MLNSTQEGLNMKNEAKSRGDVNSTLENDISHFLTKMKLNRSQIVVNTGLDKPEGSKGRQD